MGRLPGIKFRLMQRQNGLDRSEEELMPTRAAASGAALARLAPRRASEALDHGQPVRAPTPRNFISRS